MTALNRLPIVVIAICEAVMIYTATGVAKVVFTQLDAVYAAWYRVGFMALMLLAWRKPWKADRRDSLPGTRRDWALLAGFGAALVLMNTMYYVAISNMDIGIATAIEFIGPLGVAVITGHSWRERVGIGIAACGVVLLAGISLGGENGGSFLIGLIAILIGGSMWGCYIVLGGKVATKGHPIDMLCWGTVLGWLMQSVFLAPGAIAHLARPKADATWVHASWGVAALLALLFLVSLFGSFLPYLTDQVVMRRIPSARYSVVQSINPAMATFIALAFGEVPTLGECAGIALVIVAVIVTFSGDENPA